MKLYRIEMQLNATAYIQAEDEYEAMDIAKELEHEAVYADSDDFDSRPYSALDTAVTFSPAMTVGEVLEEEPEAVHEY